MMGFFEDLFVYASLRLFYFLQAVCSPISGLEISSVIPSKSREIDYFGEAIIELNFDSESFAGLHSGLLASFFGLKVLGRLFGDKGTSSASSSFAGGLVTRGSLGVSLLTF
jgi:hypothetical protein